MRSKQGWVLAGSEEEGDTHFVEAEASPINSGLACLVLLARYHGVAAEPQRLRHEFAVNATAENTFDSGTIVRATKYLEPRARRVTSSPKKLKATRCPLVAVDHDGEFFIVGKAIEEGVLIHCLFDKTPRELDWPSFEATWNREVVLVTKRVSVTGKIGQFNFSWFIPVMLKYKKLLGEAFLASFFIQRFVLNVPLFMSNGLWRENRPQRKCLRFSAETKQAVSVTDFDLKPIRKLLKLPVVSAALMSSSIPLGISRAISWSVGSQLCSVYGAHKLSADIQSYQKMRALFEHH